MSELCCQIPDPAQSFGEQAKNAWHAVGYKPKCLSTFEIGTNKLHAIYFLTFVGVHVGARIYSPCPTTTHRALPSVVGCVCVPDRLNTQIKMCFLYLTRRLRRSHCALARKTKLHKVCVGGGCRGHVGKYVRATTTTPSRTCLFRKLSFIY